MGVAGKGALGEEQGLYNRSKSSELTGHTGDVRSLAGDGQVHRCRQEGNLLCVAGRSGRVVVRSNFHRQNELRESAIRSQHRHEGDHGKEGKEDKRKVMHANCVHRHHSLFMLFIAMFCRSSCGYSPRAPGTTPAKYIPSKRVLSTSQSGRNYPYYRSYSPLIISYPRKRRNLIPVGNYAATRNTQKILKIKKNS